MEFKDALKRYRKENNLTQQEMAKNLGVDFVTANRLENGHFNPSYQVLTRFQELQETGKEISVSGGNLVQLPESESILDDVSRLIENSRKAAYASVNVLLARRSWLIGKRIADEELKDTRSENYGLEIIRSLSEKLTEKYGKGFSRHPSTAF